MAFPYLFPKGKADFHTPRLRTVTFKEYIDHTLRWHNGRFVRHPTFTYVVHNQLQRQQIRARSSFFVKKTSNNPNANWDIDGIRRAFEEDRPKAISMREKIIRFSSSLRGTRPYWYLKRSELQAIVRQLNYSHLFLTFSAADYYWDSLHKHMPNYDAWREATGRDKMRIAVENIRDNPHIIIYYFYKRFNLFIKYVLIPKFGVIDYWNRYEWQGRGSPHVTEPTLTSIGLCSGHMTTTSYT